MKVTQAIRDYIYQEINAKYKAKLDEEFAGYLASCEEMAAKISAVVDRANKEIADLCEEGGFSSRYGGACQVSRRDEPVILETQGRMERRRMEYRDRVSQKVNQICFDLEIGEAKKEEIRAILDGIEV